MMKKRGASSDLLPQNFPSPNLTTSQLRRMALLEEQKKLSTSSQRFSIISGFTNKSLDISNRSLDTRSHTSRSIMSIFSNKSKSNRSLFSTTSSRASSKPIAPVIEEDENDMSDKEEERLTNEANNGNRKNRYTSFRLKKPSIEDDTSVTSSIEGHETTNVLEDVNLDVNSAVNLEIHSFAETQSFVSHTITSSIDEEQGVNADDNKDRGSLGENSHRAAATLDQKEKKLAILGTVIIVLTIIAVTISVTVGGLVQLREEELLIGSNSTRHSSAPTIFMSSFPSFSPSIKSLESDDIEEARSRKFSISPSNMNPSKMNPSFSPTIYIKRKRVHHPPLSSKQNATKSIIHDNISPSSTPSLSLHPTYTPINSQSPHESNQTILNSESKAPVPNSLNSTNMLNVSSSNIPFWSSFLNTSISQGITSSNTSISISNLSTPLISELSFNVSSNIEIDTTFPTPYLEDYHGNSSYTIKLSENGSQMAVSLPFFNESMGLVIIYRFESDRWNQITSFRGNSKGDQFGFSVCLTPNGTTIAIGARGGNDNGYVKVFNQLNSTFWEQSGEDLTFDAETGSGFGYSISLTSKGDNLAVGIPFASRNGLPSSGRVELYNYNQENKTWVSHRSGLDGPKMHGWFGYSLHLRDEILVVGAPKLSSVYIYQITGNIEEWKLLGKEISGHNPDDFFGSSISMSSDGKLLGVGAPMDSVMGENTGIVTFFGESNGNYFHLSGTDLYGPSTNSRYGSSLSVSGDGTKVVIGGSEAGVFEIKSGVWRRLNLTIEISINNVAVDISKNGERIAVVNEPGNMQLYSWK